MLRTFAALPLFALLIACGVDPSGGQKESPEKPEARAAAPAPAADAMLSHDPGEGQAPDPAMADDRPRPVMQAQVVLDRLGFTPGVIDGKEGRSTRNAVAGFQEANDLPVTGELDDKTKHAMVRWSNIPATRVVVIAPEFAAGNFAPLPEEPADQAKLPQLGYESLDEKLAERFHTTVETLHALNPGIAPRAASSSPVASASTASDLPPSVFSAGQRIRVPNIGADRIEPGAIDDAGWQATLATLGVGSAQAKAAKIVVSKSKGTLKAFDQAGKLVAVFTATMGSRHDPLPLGNWKVLGVSRNPPFHYNPKLFWDVSDGDKKELLPPGPNGPVGVAWIDLSKPHYGIHGTPSPETIGRAQSHGCVRLTNWDVARLAQMVSGSTKVLFEA